MLKNHAGFMKRALLMMLAGVFSSAAMPLDIYQGPMVAERSLDPNVLYIHDDSESMSWDYMPAAIPETTDGRGNVIQNSPEASYHKRSSRHRSNFINRQYYNPDVTYQPPLKYENGKLISWGNIIGQRGCSWPTIPQEGFSGTTTSCGGATSADDAVNARRDAKTEANRDFINALGDFFKNEEGGTVFEARALYDGLCQNSNWPSSAPAAARNWQHALNSTLLGDPWSITETTGVNNDSAASTDIGFYREDDHLELSARCWAVGKAAEDGGITVEEWQDAKDSYIAMLNGPAGWRANAFASANENYTIATTNGGKVTLTAGTAIYHDYVPGYNSRIDNSYGYAWDPIVMINGKMKVHVPEVGDGGDTLGEGYTSENWKSDARGKSAPENVAGNYETYAFKAIPTGNNRLFRTNGTATLQNFTASDNRSYVARACPVLFKDTVGSRAYHHAPVSPPVYIHNQYMVAGQEDIPFQGNPHAHCRYSYRTGDVDYRSNYETYTKSGPNGNSGIVGGNANARPWCARYTLQPQTVTGAGNTFLPSSSPFPATTLTGTNADGRGCFMGSHVIGDTVGNAVLRVDAVNDDRNYVSDYTHSTHSVRLDQSLEHRVSVFLNEDGSLRTEDVPRRRTAREEIQNFANWYSYYRTRTLAARTGTTLAFGKMLNRDDTTQPASVLRGKVIRLGYDTIHRMNTSKQVGRGVVPFLDFANDAKLPDGVSPHPYAGKKFVRDFYNWITMLWSTKSGTPLRKALQIAGNYYKNNVEPWKEYPDATGTGNAGKGEQFGCRRAFTILMTDGHYDPYIGDPSGYDSQGINKKDYADNPRVGDVDKVDGPVIWRTDIHNVPLHNGNPDDPRYRKNRYQYKGKTRPFYGVNTKEDSGLMPKDQYTYGDHEVSDSLADIAMYYWNRDLREDMPNLVTPTKKDPAFWQHMQTFTIGLGVQGRISADEVNDFLANGSTKNILWTFPTGIDTTYEKVDDLFHAGLNGRGGTAAAEEASEFAGKLAALLTEVSGQAGSATSPATPSDMQTDSMFYEASYDPSDWVGDVLGYETCLKDEALCGKKFAQRIDPAKWSAAELLSQRVLTSGHDKRNIVTSTGGLGAVAFTTAEQDSFKDDIDVDLNHALVGEVWEKCPMARSAGTTDCILHENKPDEKPYSVEHLINYLRGDSSLEDTTTAFANYYNGFRRRSYTDTNGKQQLRLLGDIVNSNPLLITARSDDWEISPRLGYSPDPTAIAPESPAAQYKNRLAYFRNADGTVNREETILVGAGDGMLHGFDAKTGQEQFAYIPSAVHPILKKLADPQYSISPIDSLAHSFYVDGATVGADAWNGIGWATVAVGSTGRSNGGQSYFALNVEKASEFNTNSVLWEFKHDYLGTPANGKATIALLPDGTNSKFHALFGNGYGSGETGLFVKELFGIGWDFIDTSAVSGSGKSGLSSPSFITDRDGVAIFAYAGDLEGRLWKFDLEKKVAYQLLQATDKDGIPQPITAAPRVVTGSDFIQVIVGTGIFLEQADVDNTQVQTIYSVRDSCGVATGCTPSLAGRDGTPGIGGHLEPVTYETDKFVSSSYTDGSGDTGVIQGWRAKPFDNPLDYTSGGIQGFLLDLDRPDMKGLRVVDKSTEKLKNHILVPAIVPSSDPCGSAVAPAFVELDPVNGAPKQSEILKTLEGLNIFRFSDGTDAFSTTTTGNLPGFGLSDGTLGGDLTPTPCKEVSIVKTSGDYVSLLSCSTKKGRQSWRQLR